MMHVRSNPPRQLRTNLPLALFILSVRGVVFVGIPVSAAVACWWMWPNFTPRFDTRQIASGIVTPLSSLVLQDPMQRSQQAECCLAADPMRRRMIVEHWLDPLRDPVCQTPAEFHKCDLPDSVIGLVIDGQPYALSVSGMSNPYYSLVELTGTQTLATVSYCSSTQSARVLVSPAALPPPSIALAGLIDGGGHVLAIDGRCYDQCGSDIPLDSLEHQRTTLQEWLHSHPNSMFIPGGLQVYYTE